MLWLYDIDRIFSENMTEVRLSTFFDRLFRKKQKSSQNIATAPLSEEQLESVYHMEEMTHKPAQLIVGSAQSVGKQRDHNEDSLFTLQITLADGQTEVPLGLFIVADGMGGHQHGEVASGMACRAMAEFVVKKLYSPLLGVNGEPQSESLQEIMESGVREAHSTVVRKAPGGGTTLTAVLMIGDQLTVAHVGDSRAYFVFSDGRVEAITQDHSLVHRLLELGQLTLEEAAIHPQRNVLYRAIGQKEPFQPDIHHHMFPAGAQLLICSDGLWGVITEADITRIVGGAKSLPAACHELVEAANDAGGPDNISAILVQYLV
jgi:PPM family protein phosphatase